MNVKARARTTLAMVSATLVSVTCLGAQTSAFDTIGFSAWLLVATVIFLAFKGIVRYQARGQGKVTSSSAS